MQIEPLIHTCRSEAIWLAVDRRQLSRGWYSLSWTFARRIYTIWCWSLPCDFSASLAITYSKAFLSPVQLWRSEVLFFNASAFHSDCCSRVINSSWILRCDADRRGANANWHRSGDLWPRRGCPTETGLPLILRMKRGDNALYIFPFLELLIIVRSALWPKNRFLMRCCFPITSPSTWIFCYDPPQKKPPWPITSQYWPACY